MIVPNTIDITDEVVLEWLVRVTKRQLVRQDIEEAYRKDVRVGESLTLRNRPRIASSTPKLPFSCDR